MQKTAGIIGAGIAGLAASIRLALQGYQVSVFEANPYPGGKLTVFRQDGYRFDAGPSLFTMPELVDELFLLAGRCPQDYFRYRRLPMLTHYFFADGRRLHAPAQPEAFALQAEQVLGEPKANTLRYLERSREKYDLTAHVFLQRSLHRLDTYLRADTLRSACRLHRLDLTRSLHQVNKRSLQTPQMVQLFDRYATYNGSDPYQTPGTMQVIPHLEFGQGAYLPQGGMHAITESLYTLAQELGVHFHLDTPVERIAVDNKKAVGLWAGGKLYTADIVMSNMDVVGTYRKLLSGQPAPERLLAQPKSSSALIFYWGISRTFPELDVHNIFFSADYQAEFKNLFGGQGLYSDPTVYVNITSKAEAADAPEGCENWFVMINVPNDQGQDWQALREQAREQVLRKLSGLLHTDIAPLIATEQVLDPVGIHLRTSSTQGALYGNSSNNAYAAFLRHANFSQQIQGLYFCGGSVHPGGGIPLSLLSAKIACQAVAADNGKDN